jgi:hypothetical protein
MSREEDHALEHQVRDGIAHYEHDVDRLIGLSPPGARDSLVRQIVDSDRRRRYVKHIVRRELNPEHADPCTRIFNPLKAALIFHRLKNPDEALWMLFLFIHFGKHRIGRYSYPAQVYGKLGRGGLWDWHSVSEDVTGFRAWLGANRAAIESGHGGFGNHRKYESLDAWSASGTGACVASYVEWAGPAHDPSTRFTEACELTAGNPAAAFDLLYQGMQSIRRFGRVARFDYLSMASKLELAEIRPGSAYLSGSTGPLKGSQLLFEGHGAGSAGAALRLDRALQVLAEYVPVGFDVLEDALCNWQKSPSAFRPFRG